MGPVIPDKDAVPDPDRWHKAVATSTRIVSRAARRTAEDVD